MLVVVNDIIALLEQQDKVDEDDDVTLTTTRYDQHGAKCQCHVQCVHDRD